MPSAVGATLQFGTPDPLNDFDDHLLPRPLFQLSMTLTMVTLVLQIYRIICLLIIYRAAVQEKSYWRRLGEEHFTFDAAPQRKYGGGVLKPPKLHSKKARMNLRMMNWLERLVDPLVSTFRGKTSVSLAHSTGSSLKTDMMVGGSSGGGDAFGPNNLNQPSIVATKSESDAQVINYLLRMKRDHECELCSISEDVDWSRFSHNMASQGFHLLGTALGKFSIPKQKTLALFIITSSLQAFSRRCAPTIRSSSTCAARCTSACPTD